MANFQKNSRIFKKNLRQNPLRNTPQVVLVIIILTFRPLFAEFFSIWDIVSRLCALAFLLDFLF